MLGMRNRTPVALSPRFDTPVVIRRRRAFAACALGVAAMASSCALAQPLVSFKAPLGGETLTGEIRQSPACEVIGLNIARVEFFLGRDRLNTERAAPWNCDLDTRRFPDGVHTLRALAYSADGNSTAVQIEVRIANAAAAAEPASGRWFYCTFASSPTDCGFAEQAKEPGRATLVNVAREGRSAVRLHTRPGDSHVRGSGAWERNDLTLNQATTDCYEGREHWWAHSVLFPDDYVVPPPGGGGVVADFHHTGSRGQANFHVDAMPNPIGLRLRGFGGPRLNEGRFEVVLGPVKRNVWYDFVYHVRWSSGPDGFFNAWVNGERKLAHRGPTLYEGQGCYFKLANYHSPFGLPSSVIHDRVIRGSSREAVWPSPQPRPRVRETPASPPY
jgi:hypothetical protein